jgi:beta-carotene ketolase (CrtW type)
MSATDATPISAEAAPRDRAQARIGLTLAGLVIAAWLIAHIYALFFYQWQAASLITAPLLATFITWLFVGLFIVAHDCMHGSLAPHRPALNRGLGQLCLLLYAGFDFDRLTEKHHLHHRHSGTSGDPDFEPVAHAGILRWYLGFFMTYFSWRQLVFVTALGSFYLYVVGIAPANLIAFWVLPAIASSFQLFYFGTYLPHRPGPPPFNDNHRARSNAYGWWLSLFTCFHFGYHHEHHLRPGVPWWRLPQQRKPAHGDQSAPL